MSVTNFTSTSAAQIEAWNLNRRALTIENEGAGALHILLDDSSSPAAVSTTNYTKKIASGAYWEVPEWYKGPVFGIFAATGTARVNHL